MGHLVRAEGTGSLRDGQLGCCCVFHKLMAPTAGKDIPAANLSEAGKHIYSRRAAAYFGQVFDLAHEDHRTGVRVDSEAAQPDGLVQ